jgi:hypothetical protein
MKRRSRRTDLTRPKPFGGSFFEEWWEKQEKQKGQREAKLLFLPVLALFALFASLQASIKCQWSRAGRAVTP